jgi:hypothetical protein
MSQQKLTRRSSTQALVEHFNRVATREDFERFHIHPLVYLTQLIGLLSVPCLSLFSNLSIEYEIHGLVPVMQKGSTYTQMWRRN